MTRSLGPRLTPRLVERFSQRDLAVYLGRGLPFVTVDAEGRPHPMLLSYLELRAYDAVTIGLVMLGTSRSATNLVERHTGTLLVIEPDVVAYVKLCAVNGPLPVAGGADWGLGYFLMNVEEVIEDSAADWEAGMRIIEGMRYAPPPTLEEPWAKATLGALATPPTRV